MDEKKRVGFIPGVALLLAVLALVLISINAVKPTPSQETLEKAMDQKIKGLTTSIVNEIRNSDEISKRISANLLKRDLDNAVSSLTAYSSVAAPELAPDILALQNAIKSLTEKINAAAAPAPAPEPVAPKK